MKWTVKTLFSSYKTTIVLLSVYAVGLAVATFIEKAAGTEAAKTYVYHHPAFLLWQLLMVVHFVVLLITRQLYKQKKWGFLLVHGAFILILSGALITYLLGREGTLHLREGEASNRMVVQSNGDTGHQTFPFHIELLKFTLTRYPGSDSPSAYESEVLVHVDGKTEQHRIYMNKVLDIKGYRFFQSSFDRDEKGTVLSVNKDVAGRRVTYAGYLFLVMGFLFCLTGKNARFRQLARRLKRLHVGVVLFVLLGWVVPFCVSAETALCSLAASPTEALLAVAPQVKSTSADVASNKAALSVFDFLKECSVPESHAARLGALPMQSYNGRMIPVNTFSSEVLRKLHKKDMIGPLNADRFLISLLAMPEVWIRVPFIQQSNEEIAARYDLTSGYCAYIEAFDSRGNYKIKGELEEIYRKKPAERNRFDKDLMALDERFNILRCLFDGQLLNLFPLEDDSEHTWYAAGDDLSVFTGQDSMFVSRIMDWYLLEVRRGLGRVEDPDPSNRSGTPDVSHQTNLSESNGWKQADEILGMIRTYQTAKNKTLVIEPKKIVAELKYNKWKLFDRCKKVYLIIGGLLLVFSFAAFFRKEKWMLHMERLLITIVIMAFLVHLFGLGMRWYIAGYAPWSNSYETMVYVSWTTVLAGILFIRRSRFTFALATLFGGIILFVSGLNRMNPQITPLVPVLKSPWLMFHVAVIVAAYGFFGISTLIGLSNLCLMTFVHRPPKIVRETEEKLSVTPHRAIEELTIVNEMSLIIGLALMTTGTFLGAVWANESWGRYWGWDPKETWALITIVVYTLVIHLRLIRKRDNPWLLNLLSVIAFLSVLMTYFGVNYFLSGMHSYGQTDYADGVFTGLYVAITLILVLAITSYRGWKKNIHYLN